MQSRRGLIALASGFGPLLAGFPSGRVEAQGGWNPNRPIRIVVPFAAGGSTDVATRLVAEALSTPLGQPVVVENRAGASGTIAAEHVAHSAPDGYSLIMASATTHAASPALFRNLPYDPQRDFAAVSLVAYAPNMLVVHPSVPARSIQELIAYAKANPGRLNYGTAGSGSSQHISAALFGYMAGIEMTHVPYRGGAPAVSDLLSGRVQLVFAPVVEVLEPVRSGALVALGLTTARRIALLPAIPAIAEALPGYEVAGWVGLFAPAGTPPAAVDRLSRETAKVVRQPALRARLAEIGFEAVGSTSEEFATFQAGEIPKWAELVRISGATPG
ncbi:tripartite tricarboxylate transporter substrate binding protein [Roseomonas sp. OT10]|uniref:tripartite tricarboxylate transporter substrate binding protein n=1 Tax=Roseomonas cutis TaxID=2897332 RepID=UPI001E4C55E3|nr:tripartite tricarboxylate transporter substrate binding protein [Roseomonas sp. OT10]UFN48415.1 tripartite tricarboxylate transporter substrate binding protein [Roseomonas sp. OT10]